MKVSRLLAIAGLVAAGTAMAGGAEKSSTLFRFDGGTGNQVFRSAAGAPTLNTVAGVNPAGAPWGITSLNAPAFRSNFTGLSRSSRSLSAAEPFGAIGGSPGRLSRRYFSVTAVPTAPSSAGGCHPPVTAHSPASAAASSAFAACNPDAARATSVCETCPFFATSASR